MTLSTVELSATVGLVGLTTAVVLNKIFAQRKHLPPGPKGLPVVGNLLDVPREKPWETYAEWAKEYESDVIHLNILGTKLFIVNSAEAAKALFERKSGIYSGRPRLPMISELINLYWHFGFMPHDDDWRAHRKMFSHEMSPAVVSTRFRTYTQKWNRRFFQNLLEDPEQFLVHIQHLASGISLEATYGIEVQPSGQPDPFIGAATQAIQAIGAAGIFGTYIVDYLPFAKYIPSPLATFQKQAKKWKVSVDIAATVPFDITKKNIESGEAQPSITKALLESDNVDETVVRQTGAAIFASGSAATVSALQFFFLHMTLNPSTQSKAHAQLDTYIRASELTRLPDASDEASLPYIKAILYETLRLNPTVPLGFPHLLNQDDTWNGYHLPAGSVFLPNAWAILRDRAVFGDDADIFNPERFLDESGALVSGSQRVKQMDAAFGFARRACPGRYLAMEEMFGTVAGVLSLYRIERVKGVEVTGDHTTGLLSYPLPFKCDIRLRSEEAKRMLENVPLA